MAVTIEVSKGRYLRHLREQAGYNQRALTAALHELLPPSERKTYQWYAALETDTVTKVSVPMALALQMTIGAELDVLGISADEIDQYRRLFSVLDEPPAVRKNRPRGQPKTSSRRMTQSRVACPNRSVTLLPSTAAQWRGGPRAYCS